MATAELYSVKEGKLTDWELSVDSNGEIVANNNGEEFLKFPSGFTKKQLEKAFKSHNEENDGRVALTEEEQNAEQEAIEASQKLIDSL